MKVMKFGGSSLATAEHFQQVLSIIEQQSGAMAVVLSAPQGITNQLVQLIEHLETRQDNNELLDAISQKLLTICTHCASLRPGFDATGSQQITTELLEQLTAWTQGCELLGQCPESTRAQILATGEKFSCLLMAALLRTEHETTVIDPKRFLVVDLEAMEPVADLPTCREQFQAAYPKLPKFSVMPGFYGVNTQGQPTTLGRNGSDYSAAILAVCANADTCEIWTDVSGIYNADPRLVEAAGVIDHLSYHEAMELSYFGAKVLHPKTITPLTQFQVPCVIKNTLQPDQPGSTISQHCEPSKRIKAISNLDDVAMINVSGSGMKGMIGMAARLFAAMSEAKISVILISQSSSEYGISFCVAGTDADRAVKHLEKTFKLEISAGMLEAIDCHKDLAVITIVGEGMHHQKGTASRFFAALSQAQVNIIAIAQDASERSISAVVRAKRVEDAVVVCHQQLFMKRPRIDAILIGCGTVGRELLKQIHKQQAWLKDKRIDLNLVGIANSSRCVLDPKGIDAAHWQNQLGAAESPLSLQRLIDFKNDHHIINPVVIDCTSNQEIAMQYLAYIEAGFHVVTANKKANTDSLSYYHQLQTAANNKQRRFLYETNVGAGLPVIDNLQSLLRAGDELIQFEGILSGSLSYIFGQIHQGMSLSEATAKARELGYTEPNPAEDLNGMDVARKVLVIARESGMPLELADVKLEPVVPEALAKLTDGDEFMQELVGYDQQFSARIEAAQNVGKKLKYVARIKSGRCEVGIQAVGPDHPLFEIEEGENALAMVTQYYQPKPFVIRGYGAGAAVTAAGLFGDLLRTLAWEQEY